MRDTTMEKKPKKSHHCNQERTGGSRTLHGLSRPPPALDGAKGSLLSQLEKLEGARKRSSQAAYNASQFEERMTKQFFSQFKGGHSPTLTSPLYTKSPTGTPSKPEMARS
jgi:hypothetical protein